MSDINRDCLYFMIMIVLIKKVWGIDSNLRFGKLTGNTETNLFLLWKITIQYSHVWAENLVLY